MCDLQKASMWKRISALLFDLIMLGILVVGIAFTMSGLLGYESYSRELSDAYDRYEQQYDVDFDISKEAYEALSPEKRQVYDTAFQALNADGQAMHCYNMMIHLTMVITTVSILLGYLILEFVIPLMLRNGQTLGKKIFGIGVMRTDGVKINTMMLFVRTVLGKYTIETMIPAYVGLMIFFGTVGLPGTLLVLALLVSQIVLVIATRTNSPIHDLLANTVVIDLPSQMIFDTKEAMIEYKKKLHNEQAARSDY